MRGLLARVDALALVDVIQVAALIENDAAGLADAGHHGRAAPVALGKLYDRAAVGVRIVEAPITVALVVDRNALAGEHVGSIGQGPRRFGLPLQIDAHAPRTAARARAVRHGDEDAIRSHRDVHRDL